MELQDKAIDGRIGSSVLLVATIAYAALSVVALVGIGTLPAASDSGAQLVDWFREHGRSVRWFMWVSTVATPPLAVMMALMRRLLPVPHRDVFLFGAIAYLSIIPVWTWTWGGLSLHADALEPATARAIFDVADFFGPVFTGVTTTMIGPVTLLALRRQAGLPLLLGILGLVAFAEQTIETITGSTGFTQPGGPMNMQLGAGLTLAWLLAFGLRGGLRGHPQN